MALRVVFSGKSEKSPDIAIFKHGWDIGGVDERSREIELPAADLIKAYAHLVRGPLGIKRVSPDFLAARGFPDKTWLSARMLRQVACEMGLEESLPPSEGKWRLWRVLNF